ncbi:MAG: ArsR/SmtB family transcription factor [Candidatus Helarchaeota archaeon]
MSGENEDKQLKTLMECKGNLTDPRQYKEELIELRKSFESNSEFKKLIKISKALYEKNRLLILKLLQEKGEMCICELSIAFDLSQPTISHHLQKLEDAELIEGVKSGKFIHYRLKKSNIVSYSKIIESFIK